MALPVVVSNMEAYFRLQNERGQAASGQPVEIQPVPVSTDAPAVSVPATAPALESVVETPAAGG